MKLLTRAVSLAAVACFAANPARADLPPSPYIHLLAPINGAVVPNTPDAKLTFSFSVNWAEINKKYKSWGGAKNLFMAIGMHADVPGAGVMLGDFITEGQSSKTWAVSDILAAMAKENIPAGKRLFWNVIIRPHNTANPDTTDRTEDTFGIGAPAPAPGLTRAGSAAAASTMPNVGVDPRVHLKLTVHNAAGLPGEKKTFEATVETAGANPAPVDGLIVAFAIGGYGPAGSATSKNGGKATVAFTIPDNFVQKSYDLNASVAEDATHHAAQASAHLAVFKAETEFHFGNLIWGTYKGEPGSPSGSYIVDLVRKHDQKALDLPFIITVNGVWYNNVHGIANMVPLPTNATTWKVETQFDGNDSYLASHGAKTYVKP